MKVNEPAQKQSTDKTCARAKWLLSGTFREVQDARRHEEHCVKLCCTTEVRKEHRWQVAAADLNTGHNHGSVRWDRRTARTYKSTKQLHSGFQLILLIPWIRFRSIRVIRRFTDEKVPEPVPADKIGWHHSALHRKYAWPRRAGTVTRTSCCPTR